MKKARRFFKRAAALLLLLVSGTALAACGNTSASSNPDRVYDHVIQSKTVTWGVKYDTTLFGLKSVKTNKLEGFEIDQARLLTKTIAGKDAKTKFIEVTPQTKIPQLKNNNLDAVLACMTITPERRKSVDFSTPYFKAGTSLLTKTTSSVKSVKDLNKKGKVVIICKGTTAADDIAKQAPKAKIRAYNDYGSCTNALLAGQGDAFATDNGILAGIAAQHKNLHLVGGTIAVEPYGIAVEKGQTKMLNAINKALKTIKADGSYDKLVRKWFGSINGFSVKEAEY